MGGTGGSLPLLPVGEERAGVRWGCSRPHPRDRFLTSSCPDLFRASMFPAGLRQGLIKVVPIGVLRDDEIDLPGARPVLHSPFPLDS